MTQLLRTPGQVPMLPGAVKAGNLIYTSGIIDPRTFVPGADVPIREQAEACLEALLDVITDAGGSLESVIKVEAFISSSDHLAAWNAVYQSVWPEPGPARLTLVAGFALPSILIEIQAVAVTG